MRPDDDNEMSVESLLVAERPEPRPGFAAELDARAAEGFARTQRQRFRLPLTPALAGAATVALVAVVVGVSGVLDRESEPIEDPAPVPSGLPGSEGAPKEGLGDERSATGDAAQSLDRAPAEAVGPSRRKVARTAGL